MTLEQARKFLADKKVFVKDKNKEIQEKLFNIGFKWIISNDKEIRKDVYFLFLFKNLRLAYTNEIEYFSEHKFKEIFVGDILNIKIERI